MASHPCPCVFAPFVSELDRSYGEAEVTNLHFMLLLWLYLLLCLLLSGFFFEREFECSK